VTTDKTRALAGATQKKEKSQFDSVFIENWQKICRVLVRIVGDADQAQDLALETFWQLYR
jgi:RNA polymerase sigma-70 factor, ECF subfamily